MPETVQVKRKSERGETLLDMLHQVNVRESKGIVRSLPAILQDYIEQAQRATEPFRVIFNDTEKPHVYRVELGTSLTLSLTPFICTQLATKEFQECILLEYISNATTRPKYLKDLIIILHLVQKQISTDLLNLDPWKLVEVETVCNESPIQRIYRPELVDELRSTLRLIHKFEKMESFETPHYDMKSLWEIARKQAVTSLLLAFKFCEAKQQGDMIIIPDKFLEKSQGTIKRATEGTPTSLRYLYELMSRKTPPDRLKPFENISETNPQKWVEIMASFEFQTSRQKMLMAVYIEMAILIIKSKIQWEAIHEPEAVLERLETLRAKLQKID